MQPNQPNPNDGFKPKYRQFHPLTRVWVQNPFDHDIVFQVADEYNRPFRYKLPAGKVSELPGGAIATLGVKTIVNEMIQSTKDEGNMARMWDENYRKGFEDQIIHRIKETSPIQETASGGIVDLSVKTETVNDTVETEDKPAPEEAFPGLNEEPQGMPVMSGSTLAPLPPEAESGIGDIVAASLPRENAIATPNNANPSAEG